jgi:co-chaperonin GroES (HSP10)
MDAPNVNPRKMPQPVSYKILCAVPKASDSYDSGIVKSSTTVSHEEIGTVVLFVLELGPDAYEDAKKFPSGPLCKKGDFVLVRAYSGTRFKVEGQEFRIINDDMVEAVVDDPRGFSRV